VFIAEISVLEIVSTFGSLYRDNKISLGQYQLAEDGFFRDLADGLIEVRCLAATEFLACRNLLALVGFQRGRNLRSQDGIIAYTARQLAVENKTMVRLLTSDKKFANLLREVDVFKRLVMPEYLDPK